MPIYVYRCDSCNHGNEEYQSMKDDALTVCPSCGLASYHRVPTLPHTDMKEFSKPVEMHSIALVHHDDIVAFKRRNPNAQCSTDPNDPLYGVPVARTRKEKLSILENEGWEEKK